MAEILDKNLIKGVSLVDVGLIAGSKFLTEWALDYARLPYVKNKTVSGALIKTAGGIALTSTRNKWLKYVGAGWVLSGLSDGFFIVRGMTAKTVNNNSMVL